MATFVKKHIDISFRRSLTCADESKLIADTERKLKAILHKIVKRAKRNDETSIVRRDSKYFLTQETEQQAN